MAPFGLVVNIRVFLARGLKLVRRIKGGKMERHNPQMLHSVTIQVKSVGETYDTP